MAINYIIRGHQDLLPSKYVLMDYIESHGTEYIDTGCIPARTARVYMKYALSSGVLDHDSVGLFGIESSTWSVDTFKDENNIYLDLKSETDVITAETNIVVGDINELTANLSGVSLILISGYDYTAKSIFRANDPSLPVYIFARNDSGNAVSHSTMKLYEMQIWNGSTLVRRFLPVKNRETNKYGLFDTVTETFYGNLGEGSFTGAPKPSNGSVKYILMNKRAHEPEHFTLDNSKLDFATLQ